MDKINKKKGSIKSVDLEDLQVKLNRVMANYKTGNYISNEEMKEKSKKWLLKN